MDRRLRRAHAPLQGRLARRHKQSVYSESSEARKDHVRHRLVELGLSPWGFYKSEVKHLHNVLHEDEEIMRIAYGQGDHGFLMLVATNRRIIHIDKKPFFIQVDDIPYDGIAGLRFSWLGIRGILTLYTRQGELRVRTTNRITAEAFRDYIEEHCIERQRTMSV